MRLSFRMRVLWGKVGMWKVGKVSIVPLILLACSTPALSMTYYVDSVNGRDEWTGTLPSPSPMTPGDGPWRTVSKVNASGNILHPGDVVKFKTGGVWREPLIVPASGKEGEPVTFTSYGSSAGPKPLLDGLVDTCRDPYNWQPAPALSATTGKKIWFLASGNAGSSQIRPYYLAVMKRNDELRRLRYRGNQLAELNDQEYGYMNQSSEHASWTYYVRLDSSAPCHDDNAILMARDHATLVDTNGMEHVVIDGFAIRGAASRHGTAAVLLRNSRYVVIQNCEIYFSNVAISVLDAANTGDYYSINDSLIEGNLIHDNLEAGIYLLGKSSRNIIRFNVIRHNWNLGEEVGDRVALGFMAKSPGVPSADMSENIVEHNEIHNNGTYGVTQDSAIAVYATTGTEIRYNSIHDNQQAAFYFAWSRYGRFYYNIVYGNRALNANQVALIGSEQSSILNNVFYNNSIEAAPNGRWNPKGVNKYYCSYRLIAVDSNTNGVAIKNNIIADSRLVSHVAYPVYLMWLANDGPTFEVEGNLYFNNHGYWDGQPSSPLWRVGNARARSGYGSYDIDCDMGTVVDYTDLASWRSETGIDLGSFYADPLFVDPGKGDFHLKADSPAINAGRNVGLAEDRGGRVLVGKPDIGAHEF